MSATDPQPRDVLAQEMALTERLRIYEVLEAARRTMCSYSGDPCDCKYGRTAATRGGGEQTGCPELRDLITKLTGFTPYNRGQLVGTDLVRFAQEAGGE